MGHDDPAEEHCEYGAQVEELVQTNQDSLWVLLAMTPGFYSGSKNADDLRSGRNVTSASMYERYAMRIMRATSRSVECLMTHI